MHTAAPRQDRVAALASSIATLPPALPSALRQDPSSSFSSPSTPSSSRPASPRPLVKLPVTPVSPAPEDTRALAANLRDQFNTRLGTGARYFPLSVVAHAEAWAVYSEVFHAGGCCLAPALTPHSPLQPPPVAPPAATPLETAALAAAARRSVAEAARGGGGGGVAPPPAPAPPRADAAGVDLYALCLRRWEVAARAALESDSARGGALGTRAVPLVLQRPTGGRVVVVVRITEAEALAAMEEAARQAAIGAAAGAAGDAAASSVRLGTVAELFSLLGVADPPKLAGAPPPAPPTPGRFLFPPSHRTLHSPSPRGGGPPAPPPTAALSLRGSLAYTAHGAEASTTLAALRASVEALDARLSAEVKLMAGGGGGGGGGLAPLQRAPLGSQTPPPDRAGGSAGASPRPARSRSPATSRSPALHTGASPPMAVFSPPRRRRV
jgi:hypothetical protein